MKKRLSAIGNSLGLVIEKPILELLDINRDTDLEMSTDGHRLIIEPVRKRSRQARVSDSIDDVLTKHDAIMRKLAK